MSKLWTVCLLFLPILTACNNSGENDPCFIKHIGDKNAPADTVYLPFDMAPEERVTINGASYFQASGSHPITSVRVIQSAPAVSTIHQPGSETVLLSRPISPEPPSLPVEQDMRIAANNDCGGKDASATIRFVLGYPRSRAQQLTDEARQRLGVQIAAQRFSNGVSTVRSFVNNPAQAFSAAFGYARPANLPPEEQN